MWAFMGRLLGYVGYCGTSLLVRWEAHNAGHVTFTSQREADTAMPLLMCFLNPRARHAPRAERRTPTTYVPRTFIRACTWEGLACTHSHSHLLP